MFDITHITQQRSHNSQNSKASKKKESRLKFKPSPHSNSLVEKSLRPVWAVDSSRGHYRATRGRFPHRWALVVLCRHKKLEFLVENQGRLSSVGQRRGGEEGGLWLKRERTNERKEEEKSMNEEEGEGREGVGRWFRWGDSRAENRGNRH